MYRRLLEVHGDRFRRALNLVDHVYNIAVTREDVVEVSGIVVGTAPYPCFTDGKNAHCRCLDFISRRPSACKHVIALCLRAYANGMINEEELMYLLCPPTRSKREGKGEE